MPADIKIPAELRSAVRTFLGPSSIRAIDRIEHMNHPAACLLKFRTRAEINLIPAIIAEAGVVPPPAKQTPTGPKVRSYEKHPDILEERNRIAEIRKINRTTKEGKAELIRIYDMLLKRKRRASTGPQALSDEVADRLICEKIAASLPKVIEIKTTDADCPSMKWDLPPNDEERLIEADEDNNGAHEAARLSGRVRVTRNYLAAILGISVFLSKSELAFSCQYKKFHRQYIAVANHLDGFIFSQPA
jgi:hypothetical protein